MYRPLRLWCALIFVVLSSCDDAQDLSRDQLLFYKNEQGEVLSVDDEADWEHRRSSIRAAMTEIMGPLPGPEKRCDLAVQLVEEVDCGEYIRRLITYQAEPGMRVPAYMLIPKNALAPGKSAPAVLCLHPTSARGFQVPVGLASGPGSEYGPNMHYAVDLAKRGYVCLAPPYPRLADYQPDLKRLGYHSAVMKAIWDNIRGMDVLDTKPFVKNHRAYGAVGHSLGGHNGLYTAAFDDRLRITVSSCGFDSYRDYMKGDITGWTSEYYMPKLSRFRKNVQAIPFDFNEIIATIAPRHVVIVAPKSDSNFQWESAARMTRSAAEVFRLYGVERNLQVVHPDGNHDFTPEMQERCYRAVDDVLK